MTVRCVWTVGIAVRVRRYIYFYILVETGPGRVHVSVFPLCAACGRFFVFVQFRLSRPRPPGRSTRRRR